MFHQLPTSRALAIKVNNTQLRKTYQYYYLPIANDTWSLASDTESSNSKFAGVLMTQNHCKQRPYNLDRLALLPGLSIRVGP